ncbi:MAG: thiamine diphosphokinase [Chitinophagales bacterium]|nr:thiamine diphosphokinase [Chitinophagales bacterium]
MENSKKISSCVIVANGRFPNHEIPLTLMKKAEYVVCCDGAANEYIRRYGKPNAIVGDCDSLSTENLKKYVDIIFKDPNQETNDLTKAVLFCIEKGIKKISIVGGTGQREDHTLGNISLLSQYIQSVQVKMFTNYGIFIPITSSTTFNSVKGQQVSIFSIDQKAIYTEGLLYPVKERVFKYWWEGTLNECLGKKFSIQTTGTVIIFQAYHPNFKAF